MPEVQKKEAKKAGAHPGQLHAHGCQVCSKFYSDSCATPSENGRCSQCRLGRPRAKWDADRDPRDCCREHARPATKEDVIMYSLGGPGPWYICPKAQGGCSRVHPYRPNTPRTRT